MLDKCPVAAQPAEATPSFKTVVSHIERFSGKRHAHSPPAVVQAPALRNRAAGASEAKIFPLDAYMLHLLAKKKRILERTMER